MNAGADLDTCDALGQRPVEAAREAGHGEIVHALEAEQAQRDMVWSQITKGVAKDPDGSVAGMASTKQQVVGSLLSGHLVGLSSVGAQTRECPF